jgi:predicted nucleic acid-binding protein
MATALVDTSVWIKGFRADPAFLPRLDRLLTEGGARTHPWSLLEIDLGSGIPSRFRMLLARIQPVTEVALSDLSPFVRYHGLEGCGIGLVDVQLLASAAGHGIGLWTTDRALARAAAAIGVPAFGT